MPLLMINHNYTIHTYGENQNNQLINQESNNELFNQDFVTIDIYFGLDYNRSQEGPSEIFNPTLFKNGSVEPYKISEIQQMQKVPSDYGSFVKFKFYLSNSSLTIMKLRFIEHSIYTFAENSLISAYQSLNWVNITECQFYVYYGLLFSQYGMRLTFQNSIIDYTNMQYTVSYDQDMYICSDLTNEVSPFVYYFLNNTLQGIGVGELGFIFNMRNNFKLFLLKDNIIKGFLQNQFGTILYFYFGNPCPNDKGLREFIIDGNVMDLFDLPFQQGSFMVVDISPGYQQNASIQITNNVFRNLGYGIEGRNFIYIIDKSFQSVKINLENLTFEGLSTNLELPIAKLEIYQSSINNVTVKNSEISSGFQILSAISQVSNVEFINITSKANQILFIQQFEYIEHFDFQQEFDSI
ncbi:UNKNOWN [Stylonychia lemnae]|uniref:Uncharacterized protein n=1 Tax=Stylonychia lemnae TaxID=5949 RepID=A0A078A2Y0_STYLE|nr:UNKNOWN [Stylonychia lemnae]|eukprot:CDW76475.1 UNKNOWN [Stylonychia lemnae]